MADDVPVRPAPPEHQPDERDERHEQRGPRPSDGGRSRASRGHRRRAESRLVDPDEPPGDVVPRVVLDRELPGRRAERDAAAARPRGARRSASASAAGSPGGTATDVSGVITSRYPVMSDATTGVAHAKARVSTMPKLSPPSEGATSAFAEASSAVRSAWLRKPSTSIPSSGTRRRDRRSRTASGSAPAIRSRAPVRRRISGQARSRTCEPLARLLPAGEDDVMLTAARVGLRGDEDAVRNDLVLARQPPLRRLRAPARRRRCDGRSARRGSPRPAWRARIQPRSPARVVGRRRSAPSQNASAAMHGVGVIGSCRWRRSKPSPREHAPHPQDGARAEDDVRQRAVGRDDHGAADRDDALGRVAVPADARVEDAGELARAGRYP